jgi:hypothetical protein
VMPDRSKLSLGIAQFAHDFSCRLAQAAKICWRLYSHELRLTSHCLVLNLGILRFESGDGLW